MLYFILTSIFQFSALSAAFKEIGWGARPTGMGNTFVAIADDANSALYNPAGIAQLKKQEVTFMFTKPYLGLENVDLSLMYFAYVYSTDKLGSLGIFITDFDGARLYRENIISLTYALSLFDRFSAGLNLKYLTHRYYWDEYTRQRNDPVVKTGDTGSALTIDVGILYSLGRNIMWGLSCKNLIPADVGIKYKDIVPMELKTGFAYRIPSWKGMDSIASGIDVSYRFQEWGGIFNKLNISVGAEAWFFVHTLGLRAGFNMNEISLGGSFNKSLSRRLSLRIDYTHIWSLKITDNLGTHRISFGMKFG